GARGGAVLPSRAHRRPAAPPLVPGRGGGAGGRRRVRRRRRDAMSPAGGAGTAATSTPRAAFHAFLARHRSFLLTTHVNPDGDGIGSEVALALWLRTLGKSVRVLNDSVVPAAFLFLAGDPPLEVF